ncbi:hypothetical protein D3C87_1687890 [compost metagenome]
MTKHVVKSSIPQQANNFCTNHSRRVVYVIKSQLIAQLNLLTLDIKKPRLNGFFTILNHNKWRVR